MYSKKGPKWYHICFFAPLVLVLVTIVTMLLWNWLVPVIFNGPAITFWQALGLLMLSKILFTGIGRCGDKHHPPHPPWHEKFKQKIEEKMPPVEPDVS
ncbi:hypothetical protein JW935_21935 [candidate division KSB1 bacterium]|nr:hypothetical protein [candidate division KSB1 bacterium]